MSIRDLFINQLAKNAKGFNSLKKILAAMTVYEMKLTYKKPMLSGQLVGTDTLILVFCLLLNGCVSYKEVKEMDVISSATVENIEAGELSACVFELMKEKPLLGYPYVYHRDYDPIKKKWFVTVGLGGEGSFYNSSVSFQVTGNGNATNTEIRSKKTVWGNPEAPIEQIFQLIKQCQNRLKM